MTYMHFINMICPGVEKKICFKKCINFTLFTSKLPPLEWGMEIYEFLFPVFRDAIYQMWLRISRHEEVQRRTPMHSSRPHV